MNKNNTTNNNRTFNPINIKTAREHRPLRWIVSQWVTEEDGYRYEIRTGYHSALDKIHGMASIYAQAMDNLSRFGGELYADYGSAELILVDSR